MSNGLNYQISHSIYRDVGWCSASLYISNKMFFLKHFLAEFLNHIAQSFPLIIPTLKSSGLKIGNSAESKGPAVVLIELTLR